jgi:hypothetical protein
LTSLKPARSDLGAADFGMTNLLGRRRNRRRRWPIERGEQMFQRMIEDLKEQTGSALRQSSLAAAAAVALFITTSFLCAAAFVVVLDRYGLMQACLAGAALFFVVAMIAAGSYMVRKNQIQARAEKRAAERAKDTARSALHSSLADPMVVATGLQVIRAIGIKRLIPILAVGGLALGLLASRHSSAAEEPAE